MYHGTGYEIGKKISRSQLKDLLISYSMAEGVALGGSDGAGVIASRTVDFFERLIEEEMR